MARKPGTDKKGYPFSAEIIESVWKKGKEIPGFPENVWRWDKCEVIMKKSEYGSRKSEYGWEVDHINPISNTGDDNLGNLQPLNWKNNAHKGDKLNWNCPEIEKD